MVESFQGSAARLRWHPVSLFLLSLMMVLGSSNGAEIECPSGSIKIASASLNSVVETYQRVMDSSLFNATSSKGYCQARITINVCTSDPCKKKEASTELEFNPADEDHLPDDAIHFNPTKNQLTVRFRFKALGSYVDHIEEAAKKHKNVKVQTAGEKLVKHLRFAKANGITLDPPRSVVGDWNYVPGLLAKPSTSTAATTTRQEIATVSSAVGPASSLTGQSATNDQQPCPKCDCNNVATRDAGAAGLANSEEQAKASEESFNGKEKGYIVGLAILSCTTVMFLIWALIERRKRKKKEAQYARDSLCDIRVATEFEYRTQEMAMECREEVDKVRYCIYQINQQPVPVPDAIKRHLTELDKANEAVYVILGNIIGFKLTIRTKAQGDEHDEYISQLVSTKAFAPDIEKPDRITKAMTAKEREERKKVKAEKAKQDQKTNGKADAGQQQSQSDVAKNGKDGMDAKDEKDQKPNNTTEAAPNSKAGAAPNSKAGAAPKSNAEAAPNSKAEAAPNSKAEAAPNSKAEAAPKSNAEAASKSNASDATK